jgi:hypothetical protein
MSLRVTEQNLNGATVPISSYDSTKINLGSLMMQSTGHNPEDNFVGPIPVAITRPMEESTPIAMMFPCVLNISSTIDWIFLTENSTGATATRRVFLYEYNRVTGAYNRNGLITATFPATSTTTRGFRAMRYLHTTGTVEVAGPVSVYSTGTVTVAVAGTVTHSSTGFLPDHVGLMIGFGTTDVTKVNCWYPIISNTSTSILVVSGVTSAFAAGTAFVIASCVVTGTGTQFVTEGIAAGANSVSAAGLTSGLGPRIGFGSTDPNQITQWYQIGRISSDTSINLVTSPGVIAPGTPYVIEELRFVWTMTHATTTSGGLFLLKGVGFMDFTTAGNTFPTIATTTNNQRGVYWLCDAGAGAVTNTAANGCAVEAETDKQTHWAYVLNGTNTTNAIIYKYNLRATGTVVSGKMQLTGASSIIVTGIQAVTGTIPNASVNNGIIATLLHGPGANNPYFYFVTGTRLYCVDVSLITAGSTTFIDTTEARQEIPPGGIITFPASGAMMNVQNIDTIDRLIITTYASGAGHRQYVTKYPDGSSTYNVPFDHVFGIDDKQQDQSYLSSRGVVHFNTASQILSCDVGSNGIVHMVKNGTSAAFNQMYTLPFGAHATYAYNTAPANHQRIITPSIATSGCIKFDQVIVINEKYLGSKELRLSTEPFRVYYRTSDITTDSISSWNLLQSDGDLSSVAPASTIQFMFEFYTIGMTCLPARLFKVIVTYEDGATDSHYQLSSGLSDITAKTFTWRFSHPFGGTVPTLEVLLFNTETGASLSGDTTLTTSNGTWSKSINGGSSWVAYDTDDKINDNTYIRYTSTSSSTDDIRVRAVLNQY